MKNYITLTITFFIQHFAIAQDPLLNLNVDDGIRVEEATTRNIFIFNDTLFLYYGDELDDGSKGTLSLAISVDAPNYNLFDAVNIEDYPLYNFLELPNGNYRNYSNIIDSNTGSYVITSDLSTNRSQGSDSPETGNRYTSHSSDYGTIGVFTIITDAADTMHLYYQGDMGSTSSEINNIRHAFSTDNGDNFVFDNANVCGDESAGGGLWSYVDADAKLMSDGKIRMVVMKPNGGNGSYGDTPTSIIYSFVSSDNGWTFALDSNNLSSELIKCEDVDQYQDIASVHDPKIIELPDGRLKIFFNGAFYTGAIDSLGRYVRQMNIYSATSCLSLPVPSLTHSNSGNNFTFSAIYLPDALYHWDFGDGVTNTSNTNYINHTYASSTGGHTVKLEIENLCNGETDTISAAIFVPYITVSPNPTISMDWTVNISGTQMVKVELFDYAMMNMYTSHLSATNNTFIPTITLPSDPYYLHVTDITGHQYRMTVIKL